MKDPQPLAPGTRAPAFEATTTDGTVVRLADFAGRHLVLYFYPKDNTPGCNREACAFRDLHAEFVRRRVAVLGVSADTLAAHRKFTEKFGLPFPLISDPDRHLLEAYGVWGQKQFMGRVFMGIHRITYLVGPDGRIRRVWPKVKPETHAAEVLAALDDKE